MRGGRSDGGSTRNAGAGCAGRATGRTGLSRSGAEWSGDAAAPHAETGRWSATAQGGAAECSGAERKPGRASGVKFEPEVVPAERARRAGSARRYKACAETGRPEAEQRSTAEADAGAGCRGCCGARAAVAEPAGASAAEAEQVPGGGEGRSGKEKPSAKRTGGQSAEAEPARSGREAGPAGDGRRGSGGSGGRAEPEQVVRKEAKMRAEINLPGNGRRRTAAQPAERRTRTGADGQVDRSAAEIEPEWQSAQGTDDGGWLWSLRNASCRRE